MLNNFRKPCRLFAVIFLSIWAHFALAEDELRNVTPAQVTQAVVKIVAEQGLSIVSINTDSLQSNYEQLPANTLELGEGLRLGTPLREYYVTLESLEKYTEQHLFESILIPLASWYVHVFISTRNYAYVIFANGLDLICLFQNVPLFPCTSVVLVFSLLALFLEISLDTSSLLPHHYFIPFL
jgi:hypothetical protein